MITPPNSFLDLYCTIVYAGYAAAAAHIASVIAHVQKNHASIAIAEKALEDAYCAAGFAWCAKQSHAHLQIAFCAQDAERAKDAAMTRAAYVLEAAQEVDPSAVSAGEATYRSLLRRDALFGALRTQMSDLIAVFRDETLTEAEAREAFIEAHRDPPPTLPDPQMIEQEWNSFKGHYSNVFLVPHTLARMVGDTACAEGLTPESLADAIAAQLAAERGPKGECRYCGVSFDRVRESVNKGRCEACDVDEGHDTQTNGDN